MDNFYLLELFCLYGLTELKYVRTNFRNEFYEAETKYISLSFFKNLNYNDLNHRK